ncbi:OmpA family protein [Ascidiaceihabitans sp.]|uniref:OmpA family protein n=1 Tax=Ascidiaceihabitans sp. TaxID=1872644 RepID=UPI0032976F49
MIRALTLLALLCAPAPAAFALDLNLPANARLTAERNSKLDGYTLPLAPFGIAGIPSVTVEGEVRRAAWRISSPGLTPLQVLAPLREQLIDAGYDIALDCTQNTCGGFDFRFATEVLPAPNMYVNIRAYRFLAAHLGPVSAPTNVVGLFVSTSETVAHVQVIQAGDIVSKTSVQATGQIPEPALNTPLPAPEGIDSLVAKGSLVLTELDFATGTSDLGAGPFPILADLAGLLAQRSDIRMALVGHTDSVGGLTGNIALSKKRAQSVRQRLIDAHGVDPARLDAEGMGYLAPAATHLTKEGRETNRRVEAIVLPAG